jgi:hypothetical protein
MNELLDLLRSVIKLETGNRIIDRRVAILVGYREEPSSGKPQWVDPEGGPAKSPPFFTSDIDNAMILHRLIAPNERVAVSWDENGGYAKLGNTGPVSCRTPAIALTAACIAFLAKRTHTKIEN